MHTSRWSFLVAAMLVVLTLGGCTPLGPPTPGGVFTSVAGGFEMSVPGAWTVQETEALVTGVEFRDAEENPQGGGWILFGGASGRALSEQLNDVQFLLGLLVAEGETVTAWVQSDPGSRTVAGTTGSGCSFEYLLSGTSMKGTAVAWTGNGKDYLFIGEALAPLWNSYQTQLDEVLSSVRLVSP